MKYAYKTFTYAYSSENKSFCLCEHYLSPAAASDTISICQQPKYKEIKILFLTKTKPLAAASQKKKDGFLICVTEEKTGQLLVVYWCSDTHLTKPFLKFLLILKI